VQQLNHSVVLLKESDIFLASGAWRIALDYNLSTYYEVISTVKADIFSIEKQKQKFTSVSEFRQKHNCKFWSANLMISVSFCFG